MTPVPFQLWLGFYAKLWTDQCNLANCRMLELVLLNLVLVDLFIAHTKFSTWVLNLVLMIRILGSVGT